MNGKLRNMATIYIRRGEEMLMLYRIGSRVVKNSWCGVGGHFEPDELNDAKAAVLREMKEEIRLTENDIDNLALRYISLRQTDKEIRINYYFFADLKHSANLTMHCSEGRLEWVPFDKLPEKEMPLSAGHCINHYLREGRHTDILYTAVTQPDGVQVVPTERS